MWTEQLLFLSVKQGRLHWSWLRTQHLLRTQQRITHTFESHGSIINLATHSRDAFYLVFVSYTWRCGSCCLATMKTFDCSRWVVQCIMGQFGPQRIHLLDSPEVPLDTSRVSTVHVQVCPSEPQCPRLCLQPSLKSQWDQLDVEPVQEIQV